MHSNLGYLDSIAVSEFAFFWLTFTNTKNLRRAGLPYPFPGLNVGGVSEGGCAEQKAGLQVSLQLPQKS